MDETGIERLNNLTVDDIVRRTQREDVLTPEDVPFSNVRNNLKMFLVYFAKSQLGRVIKLTGYLQTLEDRVMNEIDTMSEPDPDLLLRVITSIQASVNSALQLIDKISTNDSYISLVFNDNRQQMLDNSKNLIASRVEISKDSREKLRRIAEDLLTSLDHEQ